MIRRWLFKQLFENIVPFKWINGNKTEIAKVALLLSAAIAAAQEIYPEIPWVGQLDAQWAMLLSVLGIEVGRMHRADKKQPLE